LEPTRLATGVCPGVYSGLRVPSIACQRRLCRVQRPWHGLVAAAVAFSIGATVPARAVAAPDAEGDLAAPRDDGAEPGADNSTESRAMAAYERGQKNYRLANYEEALVDFKEAASLYASPDFQYNIARCYEKLERYDEAILAYETYLRAKPEADDREDVEASIEFLQGKAKEKKAAADDRDASSRPVVVPPSDPVDDTPPPKPAQPLIITGAVLAGVGAAVALGGGIGFGIAAQRRSDEIFFVQDEGNPDELTADDTQTLDDEGRRFETLQIVTAAVGGAVVVTGVALLVVGLQRKKANAASARLAPTFGGRMAGVSLTGRF
jgi:tetratricopeptide (TPR) repeat protein